MLTMSCQVLYMYFVVSGQETRLGHICAAYLMMIKINVHLNGHDFVKHSTSKYVLSNINSSVEGICFCAMEYLNFLSHDIVKPIRRVAL